jgi:sirohydrochlorin cobaltochelatase
MMSSTKDPEAQGRALVLFAHGARDPEWSRPLERLRDAVIARSSGEPVALAYLEFMSPDLAAAIDQLVSAGAQQITIVPVFIAAGGHLKKELPVMIEDARQAHPGLVLTLSPPLGESQSVIDAMAEVACLS